MPSAGLQNPLTAMRDTDDRTRLLVLFPDLGASPAAPFLALRPYLDKRYLLPDDQGVRWESTAGPQALFAYKAFAYAIPAGARVVKIAGAGATPVEAPGGVLQAEPWTAYRIG